MSVCSVPTSDETTLRFYDAEAPVYVASGAGGVSRHLMDFLERLEPGARVLELGCGGGRDSEAMLLRGFQVDPTDGSPAIAQQASERLKRPVRVLKFDQLDAEAAYDAVWANACLLHVPREGLPVVLSKVFRALRPGGWHFANFKGGGTAGRDQFGRYFNYLNRDELLDTYQASAPWEIVSTSDYIGGGYDRRQGPWVAITARRPT